MKVVFSYKLFQIEAGEEISPLLEQLETSAIDIDEVEFIFYLFNNQLFTFRKREKEGFLLTSGPNPI